MGREGPLAPIYEVDVPGDGHQAGVANDDRGWRGEVDLPPRMHTPRDMPNLNARTVLIGAAIIALALNAVEGLRRGKALLFTRRWTGPTIPFGSGRRLAFPPPWPWARRSRSLLGESPFRVEGATWAGARERALRTTEKGGLLPCDAPSGLRLSNGYAIIEWAESWLWRRYPSRPEIAADPSRPSARNRLLESAWGQGRTVGANGRGRPPGGCRRAWYQARDARPSLRRRPCRP